MPVDEALTTCKNCGAPRGLELAVKCAYCGITFIDNLEENAIPCWSCKTWNQWEATTCEKCSAGLLVPCLSCKEEVPHHLGRCIRCGVSF